MRTLSIVIPAYNEARFITTLLERVVAVPTQKAGFKKEILVVDDGSKDETFALAESFAKNFDGTASGDVIRVFKQVPNQGKGKAVQRGIRESTGDFVLIQDADLEYDPADYLPMLKALPENGENVAVYGSRTLGQAKEHGWLRRCPGKHEQQGVGPWVAGLILSSWAFTLYGRLITDTLTAYKLYPAQVLKSFTLETHGFETDHEITAKLIRAGIRILEVPVRYLPRSREEGKKIGPKDGVIAVWTLFKYRFQ